MRETEITVRGTVIKEPTMRPVGEDNQVTNFRLVSRSRYYERSSRTWVDGEPVYISVNCWRGLAANVAASVVKRDRVVVAGRLRTPEWEDDGVRRTGVVIEADTVGHDLGFGTGTFQWGRPAATVPDRSREAADEFLRETALAEGPADLEQLLSPPSPEEVRDRASRLPYVPDQAGRGEVPGATGARVPAGPEDEDSATELDELDELDDLDDLADGDAAGPASPEGRAGGGASRPRRGRGVLTEAAG
jgi:single-strand DNA-binding protein